MWTSMHTVASARSDLRSAAKELLEATSKSLILAVAGVYGLFVLATGIWPDQLGISVWTVVPVIVATCLISHSLVERHFVFAQVVLILGISAAVVLGTWVSQLPHVALFLAFPAFLAVVTLGLTVGVAVQVVVIGILLWMNGWAAMPTLGLPLTLTAAVGGVICVIVGWAATRVMLTVTQWALFGFEQARAQMAEAREQRLELLQVKDDLLEANQELARVTDRLRAMYQVAEESRHAKETFVANVSHELRTPLNMIIGFSEMITQSPHVYGESLPPALLSDIVTIHENSRNLAQLVNDVLDLSQVDAGRMALSREWTSIGEVIEAAATAVRPLFESKGLHLKIEIPDELPDVFCDSTRIREVVLNLLSNAGRYTDAGGVRVSTAHTTQAVTVAVSDTGPGISPEDQGKLFQPFQQLDESLRRRSGGTGLGLSISKQFVEMHDGKMWIESELGTGTTFYFQLPIRAPSRLAVAQADSALRWFNPYESSEFRERTRRSKAPAPDIVPRFVLVEEGHTLQHLFERYMSDFETTRVTSIETAVAELERSPAQALIVNAPPASHAGLPSSGLRDLPFGTPAITCWLPDEGEAARELGLRRYLVKPITREALLAALDEVEADGLAIETVLLVDDEPDALRLFARMLSSDERSYRVLRAKNGSRALTLLRQRRPDVVLLDLMMPGVDGFQVLQHKALDPEIRDIPVVVISSRDPSGEPIVSDRLAVSRSGGLTARDLLTCIRAISAILSPSADM